jgi:hypothetical protein
MNYFKIITLFSFILFFANCNPKEEIAPENPCAGQEEVKADFVIEELIGDRWFEGDTIADYGNKVRFRALQKADSYMWILGLDTFYMQTVTKSSFPFGWLDAKLIVRRKPNEICFPADDGIDFSERKFYVWPVSNILFPEPIRFPPYPIYGTYRGYNLSNPNLEFNVTLYDTLWKYSNGDPAYVGLVNGIPYVTSKWNVLLNNNATLYDYCMGKISPLKLNINIDVARGNLLGNPVAPMIPVMNGYAYLDRKNLNKITIEYSYADTIPLGSSELKFKDTYIGTKIY